MPTYVTAGPVVGILEVTNMAHHKAIMVTHLGEYWWVSK